jgi:hypothetical protein
VDKDWLVGVKVTVVTGVEMSMGVKVEVAIAVAAGDSATPTVDVVSLAGVCGVHPAADIIPRQIKPFTRLFISGINCSQLMHLETMESETKTELLL